MVPLDRLIALMLSFLIMVNGAVLMFKISYYQKPSGKSPVRTFIENLRITPGKSTRIQYRQIMHSIKMLEMSGTRIGEPFTKHLEDGIWELRPGSNRVLFFFFRDNTFVLLHALRKKSQKTPRTEILKAKAERADWISRNP